MRLIDARSGKDNIRVGDVIVYAAGDWWQLVGLEDRYFWASAVVLDQTTGGGGRSKRVKLTVRFFHPNFLGKRVAFFPS
jgi:hypothetical protein